MADDRDLNQDAGGGDAPVSIHDALSSAFEADESGAGASETGVQAPVSIPAAPQSAAPADGRARDETGRFVAKPGEAGQKPTTEPATPQGQAAPAEQPTSRIPSGLSAATKADWGKLPEHVRADLLKWQGDLETAKTTWDQKAERFNRLDAVLAPRREKFAIAGVGEDQALQALFAAQDLLERDPRAGLAFLAQQYRVDLRTLSPAQPGQAQQAAPMHPALAQALQQALGPVMQKVTTLEGALAQQTNAAQRAAESRVLSEVEAFRADPANLYFDNVAEDMAALIATGRAASVKDAYDMAVWANPQTRSLVAQAQQEQQAQEAQARARAARHASGSITGSPSPGASPVGAGPSPSIRDALEQAFDTVT